MGFELYASTLPGENQCLTLPPADRCTFPLKSAKYARLNLPNTLSPTIQNNVVNSERTEAYSWIGRDDHLH